MGNWWDVNQSTKPYTITGWESAIRLRVDDELRRQMARWGAQDNHPAQWLAILTEEVGEVAKEVADARIQPFDPAGYVEELVQVAAVAIRAAANYLYNPTVDWAKPQDRI